MEFEKSAIHFDPPKRKLLLDALLLLLLLVTHSLKAKLLNFFDDSSQVVNETFVFNLVTIKATPFYTLDTLNDLVSQLQNHLAQDRVVKDH